MRRCFKPSLIVVSPAVAPVQGQPQPCKRSPKSPVYRRALSRPPPRPDIPPGCPDPPAARPELRDLLPTAVRWRLSAPAVTPDTSYPPAAPVTTRFPAGPCPPSSPPAPLAGL